MSDPFIVGSFEKILTGSGDIVNNGTFETPIIIEIAGSSTNPTVTIGTDSFSYTGTIPSGQMLIIDTDKATAKLNGTNVLDKITGPLPYYIQPGSIPVTEKIIQLFVGGDRGYKFTMLFKKRTSVRFFTLADSVPLHFGHGLMNLCRHLR